MDYLAIALNLAILGGGGSDDPADPPWLRACVKRLEELYKDAAYSKLDTILSNDDHPLYNCFQLLPSGVRINISGCRTNHLRDASVGKNYQLL